MPEGVGSFKPVRSVGEFKTVRLDEASAEVMYIGLAAPGSLGSEAAWQIKRVTTSATSGETSIEWADGNTEFDNIWDDRDQLAYS